MLNVIATLVVFLLAPTVVKRMGASGQEIMSKLMALLTAVIGVQFIIDGGTTVITELMKAAR
jgi:small neutral amino acid transporter SnatA (MarC family)